MLNMNGNWKNNMKDVYNGKIKKEQIGMVTFTLIFLGVLMTGLGIFFLLTGLFYENIEKDARIVIYIFSGISFGFGVIYPLVTYKLIKIYPKYSKLTHCLLKEYVFSNK